VVIAADLGKATQYLVDGAFFWNENIETAYGADIEVFAAATSNRHKTDLFGPRAECDPGVAPCLRRMASVGAEVVYCRQARRNA
jgi:hypothetical protein